MPASYIQSRREGLPSSAAQNPPKNFLIDPIVTEHALGQRVMLTMTWGLCHHRRRRGIFYHALRRERVNGLSDVCESQTAGADAPLPELHPMLLLLKFQCA